MDNGTDWPAWIQAFATGGAFLAAGFAYRIERRMARRLEDERQRAQAERVVIWPYKAEVVPIGTLYRGLHIKNGSDLPLYEVRLWVGTNGCWDRDVYGPAANETTDLPANLVITEYRGAYDPTPVSPEEVKLYFRDAAGRGWVRSARGHLARRILPNEPPEPRPKSGLRHLLAPPRLSAAVVRAWKWLPVHRAPG